MREMMDADTYWAACSTLIRFSRQPARPPASKSRTNFAAERLDGGCLLYRFPAIRSRILESAMIPDGFLR